MMPTLPSPVTPEVVKTSSGATSDGKVGIMRTCWFSPTFPCHRLSHDVVITLIFRQNDGDFWRNYDVMITLFFLNQGPFQYKITSTDIPLLRKWESLYLKNVLGVEMGP